MPSRGSDPHRVPDPGLERGPQRARGAAADATARRMPRAAPADTGGGGHERGRYAISLRTDFGRPIARHVIAAQRTR